MKNKRYKFLIAGLFAVAVLSGGCEKKGVDYISDGEQNKTEMTMEAGDNSLKNQYRIPDRYKGSFAVGDTGLSGITADVNTIEVPDTADLYCMPVKKKTLDGTRKKEIAAKVFDKEKGIYTFDYENPTKHDLEVSIEAYQSLKEQAAADNDPDAVKDYKAVIDDLEGKLQSAPDNYPDAGDYSSDEYIGTIGDRTYVLRYGQGSNESALYVNQEDVLAYRPKAGAQSAYIEESEKKVSEDDDNLCIYTEKEAEMLAEELLTKLGAENMVLTDVHLLCFEYVGKTDDVSTQEMDNNVFQTEEMDGYVFTYRRSIHDQPAAMEVMWSAGDDGWQTVPTEWYKIQVDSNGVLSANWTDYLEQAGEETPVSILSFDEMMDKAAESIPEYLTVHKISNAEAIIYNQLKLSYYLTPGSSEDTYEYVPAWIFCNYEDEFLQKLLVIDARDGSVIDLVKLSEMVYGQTIEDLEEMEETQEQEIQKALDQLEE